MALFTATSATCVTGLAVVDTPGFWSPFGEAVILLLFQVAGFGIMTGATLLGLLVSRRLRLTQRLITQAETKSLTLGDVGSVAGVVLAVTVAVEILGQLCGSCASASPTTSAGPERSGTASSTRSRPLTTRASPSTPTASPASRSTPSFSSC